MNAHDYPVIDAYLRWAKTQHEEGKLTAPAIASAAIQRYGGSPAILEALIKEAFQLFAVEAVHGRRPMIEDPDDQQQSSHIDNSRGTGDRMTARRRAAIVERVRLHGDDPVSRFFERHPKHTVPVPLLNLNREELLAAASYRDAESIHAKRRAQLCRQMADRLQPGQVAREVITEEDIEIMAKRISRANVVDIRRAG